MSGNSGEQFQAKGTGIGFLLGCCYGWMSLETHSAAFAIPRGAVAFLLVSLAVLMFERAVVGIIALFMAAQDAGKVRVQ